MSINPIHYLSFCCCSTCHRDPDPRLDSLAGAGKQINAGCDSVDRRPSLEKKRSYYWLQTWEKNERQEKK